MNRQCKEIKRLRIGVSGIWVLTWPKIQFAQADPLTHKAETLYFYDVMTNA